MDLETPIHLLLVDDDEEDAFLIRDLLDDIRHMQFDVRWESSFEMAIEAISKNEFDVFLFDYRLGAKTGIELLQEVIDNGCRAPVILLTGQGDHEVDLEAMRVGAADFLLKDEIDAAKLERTIRYAINQKRAEERILRLAYYDSLTGLPNRLLFSDRLKQAIASAVRYDQKLAVLFLDLDNFKDINDSYGHSMGDRLLTNVARSLVKTVRGSDSVARRSLDDLHTTLGRLGGDEFIILLFNIETAENVAIVAERILHELAFPILLGDKIVGVTASIGIALFPEGGQDEETLLKNADTAMYYAKSRNKNNFCFYKPHMTAATLEKMNIISGLRNALELEELQLRYQPLVEASTGTICSAEALLRWSNADSGLFDPADYIPVAEESGLIVPIGAWVLRTACEQCRAWQRFGAPIRVCVNLSARQCTDDFIDSVGLILESTGLEARCLSFEITETFLRQDSPEIVENLRRLKALGVGLLVDDFGCGYFSFRSLKRLPVDMVKIDGSLIGDLEDDPEDVAIVKAIVAMAHSLSLRVVAEGVETQGQLELLIELSCDVLQGYLMSRPLPPEEFVALLEKKPRFVPGT